MDDWDKDSILRLLESNLDRVEILEVTDDFVTYFDEKLEKEFTARLADPTPEWLESIIHVLPLAEGKTPEKDAIISFLLHLDPAMLAGLSGIYVRGGEEDDAKVAEQDESQAEIISSWEDEYGERLGWYWSDRNAVVVNLSGIIAAAERDAKEAFPDEPERWEDERDKTVAEQFFLTLGHEIRHLAVSFPLVREYCRIYDDVKRGALPRSMRDNVIERDAEKWAIAAYESWPGYSPKSTRHGEEEAESPGMAPRP